MDTAALSAIDPGSVDAQNLSQVRFEQNQSAGADFARLLDTYRSRADQMDSAVEKMADAAGGQQVKPEIRQLVELYGYAVDTQLVVRTSTQLTTGARQLMSGQ